MKPLTFILIAVIVFAVFVGIFYSISIPVLSMKIMKDAPQLSLIVWIIVIGVPLGFTAQIMRMVYDMVKRRKR